MQHNGDHQSKIHQEAVTEQDLHNAAHGAERRVGAETGRGDGDGDLTDAAGQLVQGSAEEFGKTGAEDGQGKTGHVLVCTQRDGQKRVDDPAECGEQQRTKKAQQDAHDGVGAAAQLIEEGRDQTADRAKEHDAGDTEVQVAAFFDDDLTQSAQHDNGAECDGGVKQCH